MPLDPPWSLHLGSILLPAFQGLDSQAFCPCVRTGASICNTRVLLYLLGPDPGGKSPFIAHGRLPHRLLLPGTKEKLRDSRETIRLSSAAASGSGREEAARLRLEKTLPYSLHGCCGQRRVWGRSWRRRNRIRAPLHSLPQLSLNSSKTLLGTQFLSACPPALFSQCGGSARFMLRPQQNAQRKCS